MSKHHKSKNPTPVQEAPSAKPTEAAQPTAVAAGKPQSAPANTNGVKPEQAKPAQPAAEHQSATDGQEVTLKFTSHEAKEVKVAGNFNEWHPETTPLKKSGTGDWTTQLKLKSGKYEYRFVVDGKWCEDPHATQRGVNPYGGFNSILNVPANARS